MAKKKGRVFSGARPTGRQHLGNYLGAIKNYVALQDDYDCVYCIVDLHALTTVEDTENLKQNTYEMALDWLGAGIPPAGTVMVVPADRRHPPREDYHVRPVARAAGDGTAHQPFDGDAARKTDRPADVQRKSSP